MWDRDLTYLGDLPVWWVPFSALKVLQPVSRVLLEYFSPLKSREGSTLTIIFESLSHLSTFFSANHPWLLWDVCEHPLPPTGTSLPSCSPDLYGSSHPAEHTSVYMCCSDIWCCLGGFADLASSVCWETETVNLGNFFCFLFPFYKD